MKVDMKEIANLHICSVTSSPDSWERIPLFSTQLKHLILAIQEAEIKRIEVQNQPGQIV
jgi:hypothetical protein